MVPMLVGEDDMPDPGNVFSRSAEVLPEHGRHAEGIKKHGVPEEE